MSTIDDAVVGWNGTPPARFAADWAADRQGGHGRLLLQQVLRRHEDAGAARAAIADEVARLGRAHPGLHVSATAEHGDAEATLRHAAGRSRMLVLGVRARTDSAPSAGRAFAIRVAALAQGPVVVVPDRAPTPGDRVVVGVDGTESSIAAALIAAEEAERLGQPLEIVHGWWDSAGWDALPPYEPRTIHVLEAAHRAVLDECADEVVRRLPSCRPVRTLVHAPADEAVAEAGRSASLVVLGRHAGMIAVPALLGTAARSLLRHAAVPTMVVGPLRVPRLRDARPARERVDSVG